jgi:hypothetical protein
MPWYFRVGVLLIGAFFLILGLTKTYFEIKSWEVLVQMGQRAPDVNGNFRVYVKLYVFVAAMGLTLTALGCLL